VNNKTIIGQIQHGSGFYEKKSRRAGDKEIDNRQYNLMNGSFFATKKSLEAIKPKIT
jgi:hypothetical protein